MRTFHIASPAPKNWRIHWFSTMHWEILPNVHYPGSSSDGIWICEWGVRSVAFIIWIGGLSFTGKRSEIKRWFKRWSHKKMKIPIPLLVNTAIELSFGPKLMVKCWFQIISLSLNPSNHHTPLTQKVLWKTSITSGIEISTSFVFSKNLSINNK